MKYDDIINLPHYVSPTRQPMPLAARAAQFAPFAALTGHDAAINETARLTSKRIELSADEQLELSQTLAAVLGGIAQRPEITVVYFQPDALKTGGSYTSLTGTLKKFDEYSRQLIFDGGRFIPLDDILTITPV